MKIKEIDNIELLKKCSILYLEVFNSEPWCDKWTIDKAYSRLKDFYNTPHFIGVSIFEKSELVGCIIGNSEQFYDGKYYMLKEMFISQQHQRKGIGKLLINDLKKTLKTKDINSILLFTSKTYFPFHFYKKNGFKLRDDLSIMSFKE